MTVSGKSKPWLCKHGWHRWVRTPHPYYRRCVRCELTQWTGRKLKP